MVRIGLTGGIGGGKSTVASLFARRGTPVIDTDALARHLSRPDQPAYAEIVHAFGKEILASDGSIDRKKLGRQVFGQAAARQRLEAILHPRIRDEVRRQLGLLDTRYCIIVVPLLFEAGFTDLMDRTLVVDAEEARQIERVGARDALTEAEIRTIMAAQISRAERLARADDVIDNNSDLTHLEQEVERLHAYYTRLAQQQNG